MSYKRRTCKCGHNKKAHEYYFGCRRCNCSRFRRKKKGEK